MNEEQKKMVDAANEIVIQKATLYLVARMQADAAMKASKDAETQCAVALCVYKDASNQQLDLLKQIAALEFEKECSAATDDKLCDEEPIYLNR